MACRACWNRGEAMREHRWSGWPGAYCLRCSIQDATEEAINCTECHIPMPGDPDQESRMCQAHAALAAVGCPPTEDDAAQVNPLLEALYAREALRGR